MNFDNINILIVGVGGQGTLLASKFLGMAAMLAGKDVKVSEVHGMSQRGGSVVTCVKIGDSVASPVIDEAQADVMLSFELAEAVRWLPYLKKGGALITSTQQINPMTVVLGRTTYPDNALKALEGSGASVKALDALKAAEECGSAKAVNIVLCGVLASMVEGVDEDLWMDALKAVVPSKFYEINEKAFKKGLEG